MGARCALSRNDGERRRTRICVFPVIAEPWRPDPAGRTGLCKDNGEIRPHVYTVRFRHPFVGLRVGDRRTGKDRKPGRHLVLPAELPERPSSDKGPYADLGARHSVNQSRELARVPGTMAIRRQTTRRHRRLGGTRRTRLDHRWQSGNRPQQTSGTCRKDTDRQPADPVPFREHEGRPHTQEHAALCGTGRACTPR